MTDMTDIEKMAVLRASLLEEREKPQDTLDVETVMCQKHLSCDGRLSN